MQHIHNHLEHAPHAPGAVHVLQALPVGSDHGHAEGHRLARHDQLRRPEREL